ncbi:MAG: type II secretion system protein [Patescibacteria group bacterium]
MKINIKKGFTLIEMLVVISMIGILTTLALVSFESSQKRARDTQRKSDLKQYQTALENFANDINGLYPSKTTAVVADTLCSTLEILGTCPADPKETHFYYYRSNGTGGVANDATDYLLWAELELSDNYWAVCSTGKSGFFDTIPGSGATCPDEI